MILVQERVQFEKKENTNNLKGKFLRLEKSPQSQSLRSADLASFGGTDWRRGTEVHKQKNIEKCR